MNKNGFITVKVIPLTRKMKNKVKQHGDEWELLNFTKVEAVMQTLLPVHAGGFPYMVRVILGVDCNLDHDAYNMEGTEDADR